MDLVISTLIPIITHVTDAFKNNPQRLEKLKDKLIEGWDVFDKAVEYQYNTGAIGHENDAMKSLIQLLYEVEDTLDRKRPEVAHGREDSKISRILEAILQCLGLGKSPKDLLEQLEDRLNFWKGRLRQNLGILRYGGMNSEVRRCLAYFSLFPDHYQFNVDDLVHLWVGECFVPLNEMRSSLKKIEEISVQILTEELILQPSEDDSELYSFNYAHDGGFAKLAAAETCLHLDHCGPLCSLNNKKTRHLSLLSSSTSGDSNPEFWPKLKELKLKLRTILSLHTQNNPGRLKEIPLNIKKSLLFLRVLSLTGTTITKLPNFICKLKQLRYLDVSFTHITVLPSKLHKNRALQFLKIKSTNNLLLWPKEFHMLTSLIYVDWDEAFIRNHELPCNIGKLSHLENLPLFHIGAEDGYSTKELKEMNKLQGSIRIENLELVYVGKNVAEEEAMQVAKEAMLHEKCGLKRIALRWTPPYNSRRRNRACDEHILKGLQPHEDVKELKIEYYGGDNLPEWISDSRIEKVSLLECRDCYLPALGKMGNLTTLVLEDMRHITEVRCFSDGDADTGGCFPKLKSMKFYNMTDLVEWRGLEAPNVMPSLTEINFDGCTSIHHLLPFIRYLMESKPTTYISIDGKCLRCIDDGTWNSSAACPHN